MMRPACYNAVMGFSRRQAKAAIQKFASDRKRAAQNGTARRALPAGPKPSGGKRFGFALDQSLRAGLLTTPDPGNGNTIYVEFKGKSFCELTVGAADETRALPAAAGYAVGTELIVILRYSAGGTATITGSVDGNLELTAIGDLGIFVVSAAGATSAWRTTYPTITISPFADAALALFTTEINGESFELFSGMPLYSSGANSVKAAIATSSGTARVLWLARQIMAPSAEAFAQLAGAITLTTAQWDVVTGQVGGLTPGAEYFLSAVEAGHISTLPPLENGQFSVRLGLARSTTIFIMQLEKPIAL